AALGDLAGLVGGDLVADADVGEGAAGHDAVVAAARAVAVEVLLLDALAEEVLAAGGVLADGACGRDVVGGDAVAEEGEAAGAVDRAEAGGLVGHALEEGGVLDVGALLVPGVELAVGDGHLVPGLV